ncbi:MAG: DUF892 family protein [Actinobacteria bacterium]|nr:DUF892 family protein [Actinomycetota bacterium]
MPETAEELFEHELRDIYDAEHKLVRATDTMAKKVKDETLKSAFREHHEVTKGQVERLKGVFDDIGRKPRREACDGINGLIEEFSGFVKDERPSPEVLNFFAIGAASKVEQYEIQAYKSLIALAEQLGLNESVGLLTENLTEEEETASKLETMSGTFVKKLS